MKNIRTVDLSWSHAGGFLYLGSPYSKYPDGIEAAFRDVSKIAGELMRRGLSIYAPITHSHPIAVHAEIDPLSHDIWLPADRPFMEAAKGLIVAQMATWRESYGLKHEIDFFVGAKKPVYYLNVETFDLSERPHDER